MSNWQTVSAAKREQNAAKIPKEWRLPESTLSMVNDKADLNVLDVPRKSGILSEKEIELTEEYDAVALLEKMAKGEVR
jgi:amidase